MGYLSRRELLARAGSLSLGVAVAQALPFADAIYKAAPAIAQTPIDDATLAAFADTIIPGRAATKTNLGDDIPAGAIAGVDSEPGAVEADVLRLFHDARTGFDSLAPAFLSDLNLRALSQGGTFVSLPYDKRVVVVSQGLDFSNGDRVLWEAAAAVPFTAFCAAATQVSGSSATASGYAVMGLPGAAPNGYRGSSSYKRKLSVERTKKGVLP